MPRCEAPHHGRPVGDRASGEGLRLPQHRRARRAFLVSNYLILGCASGCGFLTLSLRLVPSVDGFLLILLHALTVAAAVAGCAVIAAPDPPRGRCYTVHMSATVVVSILQGAAAVLAFSRTSEFLSDGLRSYVREEDGAVILRMVGGLGVAIFCLEWVALALAFVLRYYSYVDRECGGNPLRRSAKVGGEDGTGTWPWPFQV
ncbi:unnamed protein product [Urochloa decumbens]|uniref:Uncharacterized protein n=1 Tax=Urochloa decumbens TaxID=240449 RepID=A0ABC9D4N5_9POAL